MVNGPLVAAEPDVPKKKHHTCVFINNRYRPTGPETSSIEIMIDTVSEQLFVYIRNILILLTETNGKQKSL